jgi:hypothetical protein
MCLVQDTVPKGGMTMSGWGDFFGGLMDKLPIQGRIERWRNEKANLEKEKVDIEKLNLDVTRQSDRDKANRYSWVIDRIAYLQQLLNNKS